MKGLNFILAIGIYILSKRIFKNKFIAHLIACIKKYYSFSWIMHKWGLHYNSFYIMYCLFLHRIEEHQQPIWNCFMHNRILNQRETLPAVKLQLTSSSECEGKKLRMYLCRRHLNKLSDNPHFKLPKR